MFCELGYLVLKRFDGARVDVVFLGHLDLLFKQTKLPFLDSQRIFFVVISCKNVEQFVIMLVIFCEFTSGSKVLDAYSYRQEDKQYGNDDT